ncbi:MAG TPA: hydrogenase maturation protease [Anaerolineales bacterium]|nr:hydrogenase maturation protease [Anaerolineales bacterium]
MKILIGGVGYHNLGDYSIGPLLNTHLEEFVWPPGVQIDHDLSFGPIAVVQRFQAALEHYDRVVLFSAVERGRPPGTVTVIDWGHELPDEEEIQARVGEAVTGVVSLDNLLVLGEHFGIWPQDLRVIEIEPAEERWGEDLTPEIESRLAEILETIREAALKPVMNEKSDPIDTLFWQDEILQIAYWFQGEGFGDEFKSEDLRPFLTPDAPALKTCFAYMLRVGLLDEPAPDTFRLTEFGRKEGARRFEDAFSGMTKPAHGECSADCDCHATGNLENCTNRQENDGHTH